MTTNRQLNVAVTFNCVPTGPSDFGGSASYVQTGSTPDMGNVVDADGSIHLERAASYDESVYSKNVDIEFTLATPSTGTVTPIAWATSNGVGIYIQPSGNSASEFTVVPDPTNPNRIVVEDKDDDTNTYNYKPAVELTEHNHYFISMDPQIVNR
jgi:hypothetical protein